jgi:hypothetical protein
MSKVTNNSKERSDDNEENTNSGSKNKQVAIDGMDIVTGNDGQGAMLFLTASMEEESAHRQARRRETQRKIPMPEQLSRARTLQERRVLRLTARMRQLHVSSLTRRRRQARAAPSWRTT